MTVGAEEGQRPVLRQIESEFGMGAQVGSLIAGAAVHERHGVIDLVGVGKTVPSPTAVAQGAESRVPCLGRVESLLDIINGGLLILHVAKHAHLDGQQVPEHALVHIHIARQVAQLVVQDNPVMVHETQRHTVARTVTAAHEGNMMVLQESSLLDSLLPFSTISLVNEHAALAADCLAVAVGIQHLEVADYMGNAHTAVIGHGSPVGGSFLGHNLDNTRGSS